MVLLTLSVSVIPSQSQEMAFFASLYILVIGESRHKPGVQTFAADQLDETSPQERMAKNSFFNWWYLGINVGCVSAVLVVTYVQKTRATGKSFLLGGASVKRHLDETGDGRDVFYGDTFMDDGDMTVKTQTKTTSRTQQFRFLDKAMIIDDIDASSNKINPWRLCTLKQVEEMKQVLGLIPVWLTSVYFGIVHAQMSTFFTKQGSTMVESKRVKTASDHNLLDSPKAIVPISVWWLIPQYILLGFVDAFCIVGTQHLFYDQMPEDMRSIGDEFHLANGGVGNFMSSALITVVEGASKGKWLGIFIKMLMDMHDGRKEEEMMGLK
ncbi:hypothetical protein K1719_013802 [Acacia pycnantha]|nr:hypothetical protein K1719_013802 [Acacia pycnantha]